MNTLSITRDYRQTSPRASRRSPSPLHAPAEAGILSARQLRQIVAEIIG